MRCNEAFGAWASCSINAAKSDRANCGRQSSARMSLQPDVRCRTPSPSNLQRRDVSRLQTLRALLRFEAHLLIFSQRLEAVAADFGEVREQVVAALVRGDEAKAFAVVEPLNGTGIHEESLRKK